MIADAMRLKYPDAEAAYTNSGGLRADLVCLPPSSGGEAACEITWGEMFAVLPFGNATVLETVSYEILLSAFTNGFSPVCNPAIATGRFPQISGLKAQFHCNGTAAVVDAIWKAGAVDPLGPGDTVRMVTNDFMYYGGDGYTMFLGGTDVLFGPDLLLDVAIEYVMLNSPVAPVVEGRIVGP
jgi:2',3'-cyclic-nucleotide 2'-phosphodiesterase (5'-nucleotidase family)